MICPPLPTANGALFKIYYKEAYNDGTNIDHFIKTIEEKIETNLDRTLSQKDMKIVINDLIITEIFNFSISYQGDDYVQTFIAILRDALIEKYKNV